MKKFYIPAVAIFILLFISCEKDEPVSPQPPGHLIEIQDMEVGQVNYYLRYVGQKYWEENSNQLFEYTPDTLKVEIIDKVDGNFLFEESFTPGSALLEEENNEWYAKTYRYFVEITDNQLLIRKADTEDYNTHLIYAFSLGDWTGSGDTLTLPLDTYTETETQIDGWKTTSGYSESYREYFAKNVTLLGHNFGTANVIVNNVPMQVDGNGMTYVYNRTYGFIRTFTYSWWTGEGVGWDLMAEE